MVEISGDEAIKLTNERRVRTSPKTQSPWRRSPEQCATESWRAMATAASGQPNESLRCIALAETLRRPKTGHPRYPRKAFAAAAPGADPPSPASSSPFQQRRYLMDRLAATRALREWVSSGDKSFFQLFSPRSIWYHLFPQRLS